MKPYLYIVRDEYHHPVCICPNEKTAHKQLEALARFVEWNRGFKIKDIQKDVIHFQSYDFVDYVEIPYCGTYKDFIKHFEFYRFEK